MSWKKYLLILFLFPFFLLFFYPSSVSAQSSKPILKIKKTVGSLIKVRPEYEERYIILHKNTFPGVLNRIRKSNIRNYSIFLRDGLLFSYYEYSGKNFDSDMKAIADTTTKDWWKLTDPMQEPLHTRKAGEWWAEMELLKAAGKPVKSYIKCKRFAAVADLIPGGATEFRIILNNLEKDLSQILKKTQIQNFKLYLKDGSAYLYFEYAGRNFEKGKAGLLTGSKFNSELKKYLRTEWQEMKEVFHTD